MREIVPVIKETKKRKRKRKRKRKAKEEQKRPPDLGIHVREEIKTVDRPGG